MKDRRTWAIERAYELRPKDSRIIREYVRLHRNSPEAGKLLKKAVDDATTFEEKFGVRIDLVNYENRNEPVKTKVAALKALGQELSDSTVEHQKVEMKNRIAKAWLNGKKFEEAYQEVEDTLKMFPEVRDRFTQSILKDLTDHSEASKKLRSKAEQLLRDKFSEEGNNKRKTGDRESTSTILHKKPYP